MGCLVASAAGRVGSSYAARLSGPEAVSGIVEYTADGLFEAEYIGPVAGEYELEVGGDNLERWQLHKADWNPTIAIHWYHGRISNLFQTTFSAPFSLSRLSNFFAMLAVDAVWLLPAESYINLAGDRGERVRSSWRVLQQSLDFRGTCCDSHRRQGGLLLVRNGNDHAHRTGLHLRQVHIFNRRF